MILSTSKKTNIYAAIIIVCALVAALVIIFAVYMRPRGRAAGNNPPKISKDSAIFKPLPPPPELSKRQGAMVAKYKREILDLTSSGKLLSRKEQDDIRQKMSQFDERAFNFTEAEKLKIIQALQG